MKIKGLEINNKIVLAPLAGYTNQSYRKIMREFGVGLVYTEMISAAGLLHDNDKTWNMTNVGEEAPISLQLFGGDVHQIVEAAKLVDKKTNATIIDINMGCPVRKVLKANAGSLLLTDVDKIYEMVSKVVDAVEKPVSVKIRAGWTHEEINCVDVALAIEKAGASLIAVHGRTKSDLYRGNVNLDYIKMVKDAVRIPVIGNGDIKSIEDAVKMFEYTGCDAIMVGRASMGNPWLIRDLVNYFNGLDKGEIPSVEEKVNTCIRHFNLLVNDHGEKLAVLEMRSLASYYVKGVNNSKEFRQELVKVTKADELTNLLNKILV
jgi:nifR3 family TIM-barrel protein